jgi:transposase
MEKKFYIGLDLHKAQTTYAVKDWNGATILKGKCATRFSDLSNAILEYMEDGVVAMEACTFYYHLYISMKERKIDVHVANVIQLRKVIGKNDQLDAERLADMLRLNSLPESYIPEEKIQNIRILINLYNNVVCENTRQKNEIHSILDRNGISVPMKDFFSKAGLIFINQYILKTNNFALRYMLDAYLDSVERREKLSCEITSYLKNNFPQEFELLKSIPGVGDTLAGYLIAEICPLDRFIDKKKLRRYAGVIPIKEQSDKKIYATFLPKYSSRRLLRYAIVLAANCAVRTDCGLKNYYKKKKKGSNHSRAIMCVASSMSDIIYNVLKTKQPYKKS